MNDLVMDITDRQGQASGGGAGGRLHAVAGYRLNPTHRCPQTSAQCQTLGRTRQRLDIEKIRVGKAGPISAYLIAKLYIKTNKQNPP